MARITAGMTVDQVANKSGLTKGFLSRLERGLTNASVASLVRLCETLEISIGSLLQSDAGNVVRRDAYPRIEVGGCGLAEYLLTPRNERQIQVILSEIQPGGGSGEEPYSLPTDVEFAFVLAGRIRVTWGREEVVLEAGDAFTFTPTEHSFTSTAPDEVSVVLWVVSPAIPTDSETRH